MKIWLDGRIVDESEARISVLDHGYLYGDGVFESFRAAAGRIFALDEHLVRLDVSARAIGLVLPGGRAALREIVLATARAWAKDDVYLRLIVSRGEGALGISPSSCKQPRVVCIAGDIRLHGAEKIAAGLDLVTSSVRRPAADALDPRVKSLNYLNNVLSISEARRHGADDALVLNGQGAVVEASAANVFLIRAERCLTPPASDGALDGIVRAAVLELAPSLGLLPEERRLGRIDVLGADEVFLTGTGAGIVAVRSLDGQTIGCGRRGPRTERIAAAFERFAYERGTPLADAGTRADAGSPAALAS